MNGSRPEGFFDMVYSVWLNASSVGDRDDRLVPPEIPFAPRLLESVELDPVDSS